MTRFRVVLLAGACGVLLLGSRPAMAGEYNVSSQVIGEGAKVAIADTGAFDLSVQVVDGELPSVVGEPKVGQGFAFAEKSFVLQPGSYAATVALSGVTGTATRSGGGGASGHLGAALQCDVCRIERGTGVTIVSYLPTQESVSNADFSTILRFVVDSPATVVVRGIVDVGASTGAQLFADPRNPDVSAHWGTSAVSLTGSVESITVAPDPLAQAS